MTPRGLRNIHTTGISCRGILQHDTKTTPVFLPANGETSWSLLPSLASLLSGGTVQPENIFLYPQVDRSGLRNPKKDKQQH